VQQESKMKYSIVKLGLAVALAVTVLSAGARAQGLSSEIVVSGAAADATLDATSINLETARAIGEHCAAQAEARGVAVSVYILDSSGNNVYVHRMDGQVWTNVATAEMKAVTAYKLRAPSKSQMNRATRNTNDEWTGMQLGLFSNAGGLPIILDDQLIGAIGVGGSAPRLAERWSDEYCAHNALNDIVGPQPPLLEDLPRIRPEDQIPTARFATEEAPEATLPSEFVVSGAAARRLFDANQVSAGAATVIAAGCRDWISERGGSATISIIDNTALAVHVERMDGQMPLNSERRFPEIGTAVQLLLKSGWCSDRRRRPDHRFGRRVGYGRRRRGVCGCRPSGGIRRSRDRSRLLRKKRSEAAAAVVAAVQEFRILGASRPD
jgi:uncharacterized protein GlcG (DUF336 family)